MSQFKKKLTAFSAMLAFLSVSCVATHAFEGGVLGSTSNMTVDSAAFGTGTKVDVGLTSGVKGDVGQVDWNKFNVDGNDVVNFGFSNLSQTIINRVLGGQASSILGKMQNSCVGDNCASFVNTGKVILINPAGVVFGNGSQVDLNSFTVSTFDINGAKKLSDIANGLDADYATVGDYELNFLNKLSPVADINGENRNTAPIYFNSNYTGGGITANNAAEVKLDGTSFTRFEKGANGIITGTEKEYNTNKTIAIISDNIKYKDSLLKTGYNYNFLSNGPAASFANISLVTADGATFTYATNGFANKAEVNEDTKTDVVRNISALEGATKASTIQSGEVVIKNQSKAAGSDIKIANTIVKGTKLVNNASGDILITGSHNVDIKDSRIDSDNTWVTWEGETVNTDAQTGGQIFIHGEGTDGNVTIDNSLVFSASSKSSLAEQDKAGDVQIYAYGGNVDIKNGSRVLAKGNADIIAQKKVSVTGSAVEASNSLKPAIQGNINITGYEGVDLNDAHINASKGNIKLSTVSSNDNKTLLGNVNITNNTFVVTNNDLDVRGKTTTIDGSTMLYDNLTFYNEAATAEGNRSDVIIKGDVKFGDVNNGAISNNVALTTDGNLTFNEANVQKIASISAKFTKDNSGKLVDDGTISGVTHTKTATGESAYNLTGTSKFGNVETKNSSTLDATNDVSLIAEKGNTTVNKSTLSAGNDVNVKAEQGAVFVKNKAKLDATNDVNIIAKETIKFGNDANADNITKTVEIKAGHDILVKSDNNIIAKRQTMPTLKYGNELTFKAGDTNDFSGDSLKSVNVNYIAGNENKFVTTGDIQFVNSTLQSKENNITSGDDVILNNLNIVTPKDAEGNNLVAPNTVKTNIIAAGDITSKDVTGYGTVAANRDADGLLAFPKVVEVGTGNDTLTAVNVNGTKLVAHTQVPTSATPSTKGSIVLKVNGTATDAGIELTAENVGPGYNGTWSKETDWDKDISTGAGPEIHLSSDDASVAVSKLVSDKLTLNTNITASDVELTDAEKAHFEGTIPGTNKSKGYIEIRDKGGFSQDTSTSINSTPDDFTYTNHYEIVTNATDLEGNPTDQTVGAHTIQYNPDKGGDKFLLVYEKEGTCPPPEYVDPVDPDNGGGSIVDSLINNIRIPKEQTEVSQNQRVNDGTVNQNANVFAAARRITYEDPSMTENTSEEENESEETNE